MISKQDSSKRATSCVWFEAQALEADGSWSSLKDLQRGEQKKDAAAVADEYRGYGETARVVRFEHKASGRNAGYRTWSGEITQKAVY